MKLKDLSPGDCFVFASSVPTALAVAPPCELFCVVDILDGEDLNRGLLGSEWIVRIPTDEELESEVVRIK